MFWYPGGVANNSTTCIEEEGEWESHRYVQKRFHRAQPVAHTGSITMSVVLILLYYHRYVPRCTYVRET